MKAPPFATPEAYLSFITRRLGAEVRGRREALRLSPYTLAKHSGVSDQTILNIEQGLTTPNLATLVLIAVRFSTTLSEFVNASEHGPVTPKSLG